MHAEWDLPLLASFPEAADGVGLEIDARQVECGQLADAHSRGPQHPQHREVAHTSGAVTLWHGQQVFDLTLRDGVWQILAHGGRVEVGCEIALDYSVLTEEVQE